MRICKIVNCDKKQNALGYCKNHYYRFKRYGDPLYINPKHLHLETCTVDGCNNKYNSKGFCIKHYKRFLKYGSPYIVRTASPPKKHGMTGSPEYKTWFNLKQRCNNPNTISYHRYGGRGISVCESWKNSFEAFFKDMGYKPFKGAQIDRTDNEGNYEPDNCRWVTAKQNSQNKSKRYGTVIA